MLFALQQLPSLSICSADPPCSPAFLSVGGFHCFVRKWISETDGGCPNSAHKPAWPCVSFDRDWRLDTIYSLTHIYPVTHLVCTFRSPAWLAGTVTLLCILREHTLSETLPYTVILRWGASMGLYFWRRSGDGQWLKALIPAQQEREEELESASIRSFLCTRVSVTSSGHYRASAQFLTSTQYQHLYILLVCSPVPIGD